MSEFSCPVPLSVFYPLLAQASEVEDRLSRALGDNAKATLRLMARGDVSDDQAANLDPFLKELIAEHGALARQFECVGSLDGAYPISLCEFYGVFYIQAPDFDLTGYFESCDEAASYITQNWIGAYEVSK